ncbi:WD40 repeat domain-containing protein [Acidisoma cellulosilytica]|uniref:WD40 repeat domain-containing protein n=1 Tax=Acidisoma cellulosilyticum TaxID=2802395 RepID=A0A964E6F0_9PROT|nr:WD40 repeat domain-containing protein [Acidisoma cellulosilyticum]MCB8882963.1 WD40 repeat domain-containing protein [Acidisoma cellulosilyticum]
MSLAETGVLTPPGIETVVDAGITGAVFSQSGLLAVSLGDGGVQLIDPAGGVQTVPAHDGAVLCLVLDIDGRSFLTGGDDGRLVRTTEDAGTSEIMRTPGRQIDVVAVSRLGKARAVAVGREVRLIDGSGNVRASSSDHPSTVSALAFNPKGKRLAAAHYGGVTLWWSATLGQTPSRLTWRGSHIGVSWSPDGTHVMTAMQERELHGWRVADGSDLAMRGYAAKARSVDWLAKPPTLVTSGADCVVAWPFSGSGPQGKPPIEVGQGIGQLVTQVAIHPVRPLVAAGFDDGRVAICELTADRESRAIRVRAADGSKVSALAWSQDGARLAAGTDSGALSIFDLTKASSQ